MYASRCLFESFSFYVKFLNALALFFPRGVNLSTAFDRKAPRKNKLILLQLPLQNINFHELISDDFIRKYKIRFPSLGNRIHNFLAVLKRPASFPLVEVFVLQAERFETWRSKFGFERNFRLFFLTYLYQPVVPSC